MQNLSGFDNWVVGCCEALGSVGLFGFAYCRDHLAGPALLENWVGVGLKGLVFGKAGPESWSIP